MNNESALPASPPSNSDSGAGFNERLVIPLLGLTVILVVMNTMMFNLALPQITIDFGLTAVASSWIVTGYSIVFAISSITYSRLSDFVPIRRLFIIGLTSMGAASLLGFFSHHFIPLLIARLIQASGAASVPALGIVLLTRYIPLSRRGKAMATVMSSASLGLGIGPVVGGSITQYLGWNDLFLVTAFTLLLIPVFYRFLPKEQARKGTFDLFGAIMIGIGTTGLLLFLTSRSWIMLIVGALAILLFWLRIHRAEQPFVQPELFRNKQYMNLITLGIVAYMSSFVSLFLLPQVLVHLFELTPGQSGLVLFPGAVASMLAANRIGRFIDQYGNRVMFRYAPWLLIIAAFLFALLGVHSIYAIIGSYLLLSLGFSALTTSVSNEISRVVPKEQIGAGMGLFQLMQFFSGAFSVAITGTVLVMEKHLPLAQAYGTIFWGMTAIAAIAIVCALLYRSAKPGVMNTQANLES